MVLVKPANKYFIQDYIFLVEEVEVTFSQQKLGYGRYITIEVNGRFTPPKSLVNRLGYPQKPKKFRTHLGFLVNIEADENGNYFVSDQSFEEFGIVAIYSNLDEKWLYSYELTNFLRSSIRLGNNFSFVSDSFNAVRSIIPVEIRRLYKKFGF